MELSSLNRQQQRAVSIADGPALILAGPGTGKTKTLTMRIAYLLEQLSVPPEAIVALTFTNKASYEMRERLQALLEANRPLPKITTFHALGHGLLQQREDDRRLVSELQRQEIISRLDKPAAFKGRKPRELGLLLSRSKTAMTPPEEAPTRQLLEAYGRALTQQNLYDFDDMLIKTYELLRGGSNGCPAYRYVHVDEFQDTSELQYELLKLLTNTTNIFAIGDPNQSIYAFRGAGAATFDRFRADFPQLCEINLTTNYRSRPEIIAGANAVFPEAPQLVAYHRAAGRAQLTQTLNEFSEAAYVLAEIEREIGGSDLLKAHGDDIARQPRDYAVLYRTHRAGRNLQKAFAEAGLPYQIAGDDSPYTRADIQTVMTALRHLYDPEAPLPVRPELAARQVQVLLSQAPPEGRVSDRAAALFRLFGQPIDRSVQQFLGTLIQFGEDLAAALQHLDAISEHDFYDPTVNAVTLLTIHASKGLEFEHVFLCAAEEGILPKLNSKGQGDIEEERRLFYVAITRAKEALDIVYAQHRFNKPAVLSQFVAQLPAAVLPCQIDPATAALKKRLEKRRQKRAQTSLF